MHGKFYKTIAIVILFLSLTGCSDLLCDESTHGGTDTAENVIKIGGEEGFVTIPAAVGIKAVGVNDNGFLTISGDGQLYCERNDGGTVRREVVDIECADGSTRQVVCEQSPATRSAGSTLRQFYRHYGIGYSYNAVNGQYCNLGDFRCQVLNRAVLDSVQNIVKDNLLNVNRKMELRTESSVYTSVTEYIAHCNFDASVSGSIVFVSGSASKTCSLFEDGIKDTYLLHDRISYDAAEYVLYYLDVCYYAKEYPKLLTSSFRAAIDKMRAANDMKSVDDFIYTYGTHVVTYAKLGAAMTLDVQVDAIKFVNKESETALSQAAIATLFSDARSTESYKKNYKVLRDSRCSFDVVGGDVSLFDQLAGLSSFDNKDLPSGLESKWLESVKFDDDDIANSNVELVDMKVVPIWDFIPDEQIAERVEARVTGNMALAMDQVGNRNFINTSFSAHPASVYCRVANQPYMSYDNPETVDIIAANRPVATVCHEYVPEISTTEKVYVAYPIYEGRVKLTSGLCIYGGKAYDVDYRYGKFNVTERNDYTPDGSDRIYMSCGVLTTKKYSELEYVDSHAVWGGECPGVIAPDGSYKSGDPRGVKKHFGHFYLDTKTSYDDLPNWQFSTDEPDEAARYPDYFKDGEYANRMVRSDGYIYKYNPTIISY